MLVDSVSYYTSLISIYSVITILVFVFPLIMWRSYLQGKSMVFRFLFCIITQTCYLSNLVLLLGFFGIASRITLFIGLAVEYLVVRWKTYWKSDSVNIFVRRDIIGLVKRFNPSLVKAWIKHKWLDALIKLSKYKKWFIWNWLFRNSLVLFVLGLALIYNILFLNHNILSDGHCYQFSDIPVHLKWVYSLMHGELFCDGIYPFYMHAMIYVVTTISGIHIREVILYYGGYQTLMLILCSYCVAKKVFCNKYLALMPVMLFSILMRQARYIASLPQECGMFATMCLAYFMISYVQTKREHHIVPADLKKKSKGFFRLNQYLIRYHINIDALLIMLSVTLVIGYHFYTAIAAFVLILGFAIVYFVRFLKKENWVPLLAAGIAGVIFAVTPFVACLAKGMKFQASMAWAASLITGDTWVNEEQNSYQDMFNVHMGNESSNDSISQPDEKIQSKKPAGELAKEVILNSESLMFGQYSARVALVCIAASFAFLLISVIVKRFREASLSYIVIGIYIIILTILVSSEQLGLPEIIDTGRGGVFLQPFLVLLYTVPFDIVLRIISLIRLKGFAAVVSAVSVAATVIVCLTLIKYGYLHEYLIVNGAYYNEVDYVCKNIRNSFPDKSFTIVSPTDDYYAVVDEGYHTELSELMYMIDGGKEEFIIPSEYVFFIIEKKAYQDYTYGPSYVNPEIASKDMLYSGTTQDYFYQRLAIESKAYYWSGVMKKMYPKDFTVYFENDVVLVYLLRQNTYYPFSLKVDYKSSLPSVGLAEELGIEAK